MEDAMAGAPELIEMDEAIRRAKADPSAPTIGEMQARQAQTAKEVEAEYGPHVPSIYLHLLPRRGRPKVGEPQEPVQTKSVRMPPVFWDEFRELAGKDGMTLHAAIRSALVDWVEKKHVGQPR
jgi:hypothetical protein